MEFAGMKPEQLGRVKVTSVSECFLAEKEWQTVTRRGAVLACVGVPTVRKIEVELLMRAKTGRRFRCCSKRSGRGWRKAVKKSCTLTAWAAHITKRAARGRRRQHTAALRRGSR